MAIAAITYDIQSGYEEEIAKIFADFKRVSSPVVRDQEGREVARMLGTALFIRADTMVRFIQYEGSLEGVAQQMATHPGVQEAERKLAPYLATPRDTATVRGFVATFMNSTMRCISQLSMDRTEAD